VHQHYGRPPLRIAPRRPPSPLPLTGKIASAVCPNLQKQFDAPGWYENCIEIRTAPHHTHLVGAINSFNFNVLENIDCIQNVHTLYTLHINSLY
jgi:hypothetical protein